MDKVDEKLINQNKDPKEKKKRYEIYTRIRL